MPRLIRRKPLAERLQAYLNPLDFLLWLSEEFETREWDTKEVANPLGLALNFLLLIARANTGRRRADLDDVFGDGEGNGWGSALVSLQFLFGIGKGKEKGETSSEFWDERKDPKLIYFAGYNACPAPFVDIDCECAVYICSEATL
jgi:hypothetical protein